MEPVWMVDCELHHVDSLLSLGHELDMQQCSQYQFGNQVVCAFIRRRDLRQRMHERVVELRENDA